MIRARMNIVTYFEQWSVIYDQLEALMFVVYFSETVAGLECR